MVLSAARCDLGATLSAAGRAAEARQALGRAVDLEPDHLEAQYNLGNMHRQAAEFGAALRCYDAVRAAATALALHALALYLPW